MHCELDRRTGAMRTARPGLASLSVCARVRQRCGRISCPEAADKRCGRVLNNPEAAHGSVPPANVGSSLVRSQGRQLASAFMSLVAALSLSITACAAVESGEAGRALPMPPDAAKISQKLLDANCQLMSTTPPQFELCVRVQAAQLPPLDPTRREHFGEQYSPQKYLECRLKTFTGGNPCEPYRLRRQENPEYWPNPNVPKPKWPEAPKESVYREGMSGKEYFEALCKAEAGEFIYKTVENVEGIYQIRPRKEEGDYAMQDRYVMEDPYGYFGADQDPKQYYVQPYLGKFNFFEVPISNSMGAAIKKYYRDEKANPGKTYQTARDGRFVTVPYLVTSEQVQKSKSHYGYVWRGISRPHDRELGIAGGELIVVDLNANEIMAVRRGFSRSGYIRNATGFWWMTAQTCPQTSTIILGKRQEKPDFWFVYEVLKPMPNINESIGGNNHGD